MGHLLFFFYRARLKKVLFYVRSTYFYFFHCRCEKPNKKPPSQEEKEGGEDLSSRDSPAKYVQGWHSKRKRAGQKVYQVFDRKPAQNPPDACWIQSPGSNLGKVDPRRYASCLECSSGTLERSDRHQLYSNL